MDKCGSVLCAVMCGIWEGGQMFGSTIRCGLCKGVVGGFDMLIFFSSVVVMGCDWFSWEMRVWIGRDSRLVGY